MEKLIRDRIPEIVEAKGESLKVRRAGPMEFRKALADKLVEEAVEFRQDRNIEELADVFEVMRSIGLDHGIPMEQIAELADQKREARGGFREKLMMTLPADVRHARSEDVAKAMGAIHRVALKLAADDPSKIDDQGVAAMYCEAIEEMRAALAALAIAEAHTL